MTYKNQSSAELIGWLKYYEDLNRVDMRNSGTTDPATYNRIKQIKRELWARNPLSSLVNYTIIIAIFVVPLFGTVAIFDGQAGVKQCFTVGEGFCTTRFIEIVNKLTSPR